MLSPDWSELANALASSLTSEITHGLTDKVKLQIFFGFPLGDLVGVDQTMASRVNNTSK